MQTVTKNGDVCELTNNSPVRRTTTTQTWNTPFYQPKKLILLLDTFITLSRQSLLFGIPMQSIWYDPLLLYLAMAEQGSRFVFLQAII